jgi:multiple sugar transport system ATP-binding protein
VIDLERRVREAEALGQHALDRTADGVAVLPGLHEHVRGQRREPARHGPDVQVVRLDDVLLANDRAADELRIDVARRTLEEQRGRLAQQPRSRDEDERRHRKADDRIEAIPPRREDDETCHHRAGEGGDVRRDVDERRAHVHAVAARRSEQRGRAEIDGHAGERDHGHEPSIDVVWGNQTANRPVHDPDPDEQERDAVDLGGQDLRSPEPERPAPASGLRGKPGGDESQRQRDGVAEHVPGVGEQRERVGDDAAGDLEGHQAGDEGERGDEPAAVPPESGIECVVVRVAHVRRMLPTRRPGESYAAAGFGKEGSEMAGVTFDGVGKIYPDGTRAVYDVDLLVKDGEFMVLVGPSGCGKTTALRMVAGLEEITEGELKIGDRVVNRVAPKDRDIAMVFQSYALYPHLTVYDNIAFGLRLRKTSKGEIDKRVKEAARILDLEQFLDRKPKALSGGQRQRVAMGRAIVRQPQAFLMDEPLSNLDAKLRVQMRAEISQIQRNLGTTTIYVTHDQVEAMTMGDRVAVMRKGELQQVAPPQELYDRPVNLFVGGFIGSPAMNMLEATLERENGELVVAAGSQRITLDQDAVQRRPSLKQFEGREIVLGIRPEDLEDAAIAKDVPDDRRIHGHVALREALGSELMVHFTVDAKQAFTEDVKELAQDVGDDRVIAQQTTDEQGNTTLVGRFSSRSSVREGQETEVAVDTHQLHFFDPETGQAIYGSTN